MVGAKVVVDVSFVAAMIFEVEKPGSDFESLILAKTLMLTPSLFWYEFGNVSLNKLKKDPNFESRLKIGLEFLMKMDIRTTDFDQIQRNEVLKLAIKYNLTYYDASYLYMALANQCKLLTLDSRLINAYNQSIC
jgi:predicted nucleic acid-binding protein